MLWSTPTHTPDTSLVRALTRPGMHVRPAHDDLGVIAALLDGLSTADLARSGQTGEHRILLLVEPDKLRDVPDCVELLSRYVQDLTIWIFDPSRSNSLRAVLAKDLRATMPSTPAPATRPAQTRDAKPGIKVDIHPSPLRTLRLRTDNPEGEPATLTSTPGHTNWVGPWSEPSPPPDARSLRLMPAQSTPEKPRPEKALTEKASSENLAPEPLLSDEELAMLLGDDPPAPPRRKG